MKIGILTYHRSHNYGAFLQAYALSRSLARAIDGSIVEIIDCDTKAAKKKYLKFVIQAGRIFGFPYYLSQYLMFHRQLKKLPLSEKSLVTDDIDRFRNTFGSDYDVIVAGSDQIWITKGFRGFPNIYWLPGEYKALKISYAASSRSDFSKLTAENQTLLKEYLNDFAYIGVRDEATLNEVNRVLADGKTAHFNPDPVFSYDFGDVKEQGRRILAEKFGVREGEKTLGIMLNRKNTAAKLVRWANGHGYTPIALYRRQVNARNAMLDPFEWIAVIAALDGIVTSYFHGTCFAIKYNTPFISLEERKTTPEMSKIFDLLKRVGALERYVSDKEDYLSTVEQYIARPVDFTCAVNGLYRRFEEVATEIKSTIDQQMQN